MKIWSSEYVFNHPWEKVAAATWQKYPNPKTPAILGTDVVERNVINGVLHTHRLIISKWYFPGWAQALIGTANLCFAKEWSTVDPVRKVMTLKTVNLTFYRHISVDEALYYEPHPNDKTKTLLRQEAVVNVQGVPLSDLMERLLTNAIVANAQKGRLGLEWVIDRINSEVKDFAESADELIMSTKRSLDDMAESAKKSMDDISAQAGKHMHM